MLALLVGLIEIGLGLGKLGFVADLLSSEVQVGYMNGLAITIIVGQLPKLFGFSTDADSFVDELRAFVNHIDETEVAALLVGVGVLLVLLVLPRITRIVPAVLVAVAGATILSAVLDLASEGVSTVGALPSGLPHPSLPWTSLSDVGPLLLAAIGIVLVSLTDTIATASSFAARRGDELEPEPGDDRHRRRQRRRRLLPGVRHLHQRIPHRGRRAVGRQEPGHRRRRRRRCSSCCCCSSTHCSPTCHSRHWRPW